MDTKELIKKVRAIQIKTSRMVNDVFAGQYSAAFKGRGMEFDEVREYVPGDEIRAIDWNVTARTGVAHVKQFIEERQLTVLLLVDVSGSSRFGTTTQMKNDLITELAALLSFSAIKSNDRIGLMLFTDRIECFIPPKKGKTHVLRLIRELLEYRPAHLGTDIRCALEYLNKVQKKRAVVFLISDFLDKMDFDKELFIAHKRHDMIGVTVTDPAEETLPNAGLVSLVDAESKRQVLVDTASVSLRRTFAAKSAQRKEQLERLFQSARRGARGGMDHLALSTDRPYLDDLKRLFRKRERRMFR